MFGSAFLKDPLCVPLSRKNKKKKMNKKKRYGYLKKMFFPDLLVTGVLMAAPVRAILVCFCNLADIMGGA